MDPRDYGTQQIAVQNSDKQENSKEQESNKPLPSVNEHVEIDEKYVRPHSNLVDVQIKSTHSAEEKGQHHHKNHKELDIQHKKHTKQSQNLIKKTSQEHQAKSDGQKDQNNQVESFDGAIRKGSRVQQQIRDLFVPNKEQNNKNSSFNEGFVKKIAISVAASLAAAGLSRLVTEDKGLSAIAAFGAFAFSLIIWKK